MLCQRYTDGKFHNYHVILFRSQYSTQPFYSDIYPVQLNDWIYYLLSTSVVWGGAGWRWFLQVILSLNFMKIARNYIYFELTGRCRLEVEATHAYIWSIGMKPENNNVTIAHI